MGWGAIAYVVCVIPFAVFGLLTDESLLLADVIVAPTMLAAVLLFFGAMIRTAVLLPRDFDRLYRRARWLGIVAGAAGFPILTYPAFIAVSRLGQYAKMRDGGEPDTAE